MYRVNFYESTCLRCDQTVYQVDRVGPLKDFTFFHSGCFKCAVCGTKLTLKTYYNNQHRQEDKEVYCSGHVPKIGPGHLDGSAVGIRSALNVPKTSLFVNEQIRSTNGSTVAPAPQLDQYQYGRFDASALHIAHALRATEIHRAYNKAREKPIEYYLDKDEQTQLEMKHRKEEDDLYRKFIRQREEEDKRIKDEIR
ncbi:hillarin-like, partial [Halyomorpha halys]